jgi:hypothetical protein
MGTLQVLPGHHEIFFWKKFDSSLYQSFFFNFFMSHQKWRLATRRLSGYKSNRQAEKFKNITGCWWTTLIYQLNMEISKEAGYKYSQILQKSWRTPNIFTKNMAIFLGIFQKIALTILLGTFCL